MFIAEIQYDTLKFLRNFCYNYNVFFELNLFDLFVPLFCILSVSGCCLGFVNLTGDNMTSAKIKKT